MSSPPVVLIVTNLDEVNIASVVSHLEQHGVEWFRFNTESFPLAASIQWNLNDADAWAHVTTAAGTLDTRDVRAVWYRRPVPPVIPSDLATHEAHLVETECKALLSGLIRSINAKWLNNPISEELASDKLRQLLIARELGLSTPRTLVTNDPVRARHFYEECEGRVLFKTVSGGAWIRNSHASQLIKAYGQHLSLPPAMPTSPSDTGYFIFSELLTSDRLEHLENIRMSPVMFQEFIDKSFDIRVTIVGDELFACRIHSQTYDTTSVDFRRFVNAPEQTPLHELTSLPLDIEQKLRLLMDRIGLIFGCIDLIVDGAGRHLFLEVNPAGQWAWIEHHTKAPISHAIANELSCTE